MGYIKNSRKSTNKPEKGALDTVENQSIDKEPTEAAEKTDEEITEEEGVEEQPVEEAETAEEVEAETEKTEEETAEAPAPTEEAEEAEEEEKEEKEKPEKAAEVEIVEERIYTIPLRRAWIAPRKERTPRAMRIVKSFVQRHMKIETGVKGEEEEEEERLVISNEVNEKLWNRGIEKPPRNIRVRAVKDKEGVITLYLAEGD